METKIIKIDDKNKQAAIAEAARLIKHGEVVAFPTETVYGLGANGLDATAAHKIYAAKGRPSDNPLILHIDSIKMLAMITERVPMMAMELLAAFSPGPLTIIVKKRSEVPDSITGGLDTVGVRMPDNEIARALIREANTPIAAPSANLSGRPSPTSADMVAADLQGKIPLILDGGASKWGVESTIVDCTGTVPCILRPGAITKEMLEEIFPRVEVDAALISKDAVPKAPGLKYRHYAPQAPVEVAVGKSENVVSFFQDRLTVLQKAGKKVGMLISAESASKLPSEKVTAQFIYGSRKNLPEIAANLYMGLNYFD